MSKAKYFLLAAAATAAAMAFILSCSDELKPIERETLEDYQRTLSSSGGAANPSSSSEGTNLSSSSEAEPPYSSSGGEQKAAVSGVSQKGPFLNNSSVTLYELDNDLVQTGRSFHGTTDEKGGFEIKGIELASPYALLKADGFYRNEVTGGNSSAPITLYAIADMGGKSSANVNVLTHLEYYRVQELAKGKSLAEAKKQALGEILAVFGIDGNNFKGSEEMSVFGTGDADAALLAISILLQGNLSEGSFLALLADFSQKLKDSGTWDNKAKKSEMAEWASSADLAAIRGNIEGWGLSPDVPDFEKYIRSYAEANSPKGGCKPSENEFCYNERIYDKCGDGNGLGKHEYDPVTQFCHNNYTVAKCGGKEYLPPDERCSYGVIENKCGTEWYDPSKKYCLDDKFYSCGNKPYNPVAQFCHDLATIYDKCGGNEYNPATHSCHNNQTYTCGNLPYDPSTHFCYSDNKTYSCGNLPYDPSTHFCYSDNKTYSCGNLPYDPAAHFCLGSAITQLCGGEIFTNSQFCSGNNIYDKCGGTVTFAPGTEACCGNAKYTLATQFCHTDNQTYTCGNKPLNPATHFCDTRESKLYKYVKINTQIWMAENLNYNASGSVCYGNNSANCSTYGRLYNWATTMNGAASSAANPSGRQGVCPAGWHIPSDAEWDALVTFVGSNTTGTKLKAASGWNNNGNGTDDYGFRALPGGDGWADGSFYDVGNFGHWWSATEKDANYAYNRRIRYNSNMSMESDHKSLRCSVRCVKN